MRPLSGKEDQIRQYDVGVSDYEELGSRHLEDQGRRTEGFTAWDIYKDLIFLKSNNSKIKPGVLN